MKEMFAFFFLMLFDHGAFATKGMYCIGSTRYWLNAVRTCHKHGGTSLPYVKGLRNVIDILHAKESIWTADYVHIDSLSVDSETLCGFRNKSRPYDSYGQIYFGDCAVNRSYICQTFETMIAEIREGSYENAVNTCKTVNQSVINTISNFPPGYYWMKNTIVVKRMVADDEDGKLDKYMYMGTNFKCSAYSVDAGQYFRACSDWLLSLCHFDDQPKDAVYWTCVNASETSTESSPLSTSVEEHRTIIDDKQPVDKSKRTDVGKVVGLSVGLCFVLICGIILSIYMSRRYKCWKTTESKDDKSLDVSYSRDQIRFHNNNSYEETENATMMKPNRDTDKPKKSNASKVDNAPAYAVVNKAKVYQNNLARNEMSPNNKNINGQSSNSMKNEIYSFAKETNIEINNDGKGNGINDDEYDVAGNAQGKSKENSNNVYNSLGNEEYNTVANVKSGDKFDKVYSHTQTQSESYYACSSQVSNATPCDNVYNHLS